MGLGLGLRVGDGHHNVGVGGDPVADVHLTAVDDVVRAVLLGSRTDSLKTKTFFISKRRTHQIVDINILCRRRKL